MFILLPGSEPPPTVLGLSLEVDTMGAESVLAHDGASCAQRALAASRLLRCLRTVLKMRAPGVSPAEPQEPGPGFHSHLTLHICEVG